MKFNREKYKILQLEKKERKESHKCWIVSSGICGEKMLCVIVDHSLNVNQYDAAAKKANAVL